ncbi:uncharacterized protein TNIN_183591 [Trichonephila inaurata madagascariensis]|uniref:Sperm microtubule inner protein 1 C-terminal domain-containing protein n=1 Tax=Trichonephila inaurata madagascariensis TaxID=2747483 RepID=A0A8X7CA98_9ARAC|nr:uncharacterized protein TNIN_183591 [Trichonephila inaurata madagascariensis]
MAREKMFDPAFQKTFTEAIYKENDIRLKWNLKYGPRFKSSGGVKWDEDPDATDEEEEEMKEKVCLYKPPGKKMPTREESAWPASTTAETNTVARVEQPPSVMKPVNRESKQLLYHGISHDGEGRALYLSHRYKKTPMERYYFPIVSSWEYGWDYGQDEGFYCPKHGRS